MIEVFLVDDEQRALDTLSDVLTTFFDHVNVCGTATNVEDAYHGIKYKRPQLVFLDVEMGPESGFQLLEKFDTIDFQVAFVTAHEEFALKAIKFSALDYIIKPAGVDDVKKLLQKVENRTNATHDLRVKHMFGNFMTPDPSEHKITLPTSDGFEFAKVDDILYICANGSYCHVFFKDSKFVCSKNLKFFENVLEGYGFYRVHNSTIVNLKYVKRYSKKAGGTLEMEDGNEFSLAKNRKEQFLNLMAVR